MDSHSPARGPIARECSRRMQASLNIESGQGNPQVHDLQADRPVTHARNRTNTPIRLHAHASPWQAEPRALIEHALHTALQQTRAVLTGFLSLDPENPLPKMVYPETAQVDAQLSRRLTAAMQREGRPVRLSSGRTPPSGESDSLVS